MKIARAARGVTLIHDHNFSYHTIFLLNLNKTNGLSHPYQMDESTFIFTASGVIFHFYFIF